VLSTRPDLVSERIASELRLLQDQVAPFGFADVERTIEEELGRPIDDIFEEFDEEPVASASVAQVHRAVLHTGREVAVKVQRPEILEKAGKDLLILKLFFTSLEKVIPHFRNLSTADSIREIGFAIERQLDFTIEVENRRQFVRNFAAEKRICFPEMIDGLCTRKVLGMEFVRGAKGDRPQDVGADPREIARLGLRALVKMVFVDGFLHCDPHPGNIFVLPDGRIMFIDLGLCARLPPEVQQNLLNLIGSLVQGNVEATARLFLKTCVEVKNFDYPRYQEDIRLLIDRHLKTTIKQMEATLVFKNLFEIVWKYNLKLNSDYALVFMALITVEGLGKSLDPDLDLMLELQAIMASLLFGA
jgi:ubiquinone biosynthesis protein